MKIGIIGTGAVGCACAMAAVNRGSARHIVLVNRTRKTAEAVATDIRYGTPLGGKVEIDSAGQSVGHDQRGRSEVVGPHFRMNAALEVAVAGENAGHDEIVISDGLGDFRRQGRTPGFFPARSRRDFW